jgi:hypothetical protein
MTDARTFGGEIILILCLDHRMPLAACHLHQMALNLSL